MKKLFVLRQPKRKWLHKQQGYALFQLGIVLALLLIICTLSLPRFSFLQHRLVRTEIEKIMLMFRYIQRMALACNQDQYLQLYLQQGWYQGVGHREYLPVGVKFFVLPGVYGPPSHPHKALTRPTTYKNDRVTFYANGIIQAGTIYLTDKNNQVMYALSSAISPIAYIRAYRYDIASKEWVSV